MDQGDAGVRGWLHKTARAHFWRVAGWCEFEDLIQDGMLLYHRIVTRYPNVTEPKHRMRLFQTAFTNHIHDLSKKRTKLETAIEFAEEQCSIQDPTVTQPDTSVVLATLSPVLQSFVALMQTNPRARFRHRIDHRETTNERICRLIGADPQQINVLQALRDHLSTGTGDPLSPAV